MKKAICWAGIVFGWTAAFGLLQAADQISIGSGLRKQRQIAASVVYKLVKSDLRCVVEPFYDSGCTKPLAKSGPWYTWRASQATWPERSSMTLRVTIQHLGLPPAPPPPPPPGRQGVSVAPLAQAYLAKAITVKISWAFKKHGDYGLPGWASKENVIELRLAPGQTEELCYEFNPQYFLSVLPPNPLSFDVRVDTANAIDESDEGNNIQNGKVMFVIQ
ncbi:MAG: hypothetical protein MUC72_08925 [Acidobacteria bacterium]|nr:hypothetical protein [Acidobacteriota bacterium]